MQKYDVKISKLEPQLVVSAREVVPIQERLSPTLYRLFDQLFGHLMYRHGLALGELGAATCIYHSWDPQIDVEAAIPIPRTVPGAEHARVYTLDGVETAACLSYVGPLTTLHEGYQAIMQWIEANGYKMAGQNREINTVFVGDIHAAGNVTDLQIPILKV